MLILNIVRISVLVDNGGEASSCHGNGAVGSGENGVEYVGSGIEGTGWLWSGEHQSMSA